MNDDTTEAPHFKHVGEGWSVTQRTRGGSVELRLRTQGKKSTITAVFRFDAAEGEGLIASVSEMMKAASNGEMGL